MHGIWLKYAFFHHKIYNFKVTTFWPLPSTSSVVSLQALVLLQLLTVSSQCGCQFLLLLLSPLIISGPFLLLWLIGKNLPIHRDRKVLLDLSPLILHDFCGISHLDLKLYIVKISLYTVPAISLDYSVYGVPVCILHSTTTWWTVSETSLHNLHLGPYLVW